MKIFHVILVLLFCQLTNKTFYFIFLFNITVKYINNVKKQSDLLDNDKTTTYKKNTLY